MVRQEAGSVWNDADDIDRRDLILALSPFTGAATMFGLYFAEGAIMRSILMETGILVSACGWSAVKRRERRVPVRVATNERFELSTRAGMIYNFHMKPGTYAEIMRRIGESKSAELRETARSPFSEKLASVNRVSQTANRMLSEGLPEAVFKVLRLFNEGVDQGIFSKYAIAGGFAVEFYGAPINTVDIDFLGVFPESGGGVLDPSVYFEFFKRKGAETSGEYLVLNGLKFQIIPANQGLDAEALGAAIAVVEGGVQFFVVTVEHLIAMKLKAWRYKDRLHINHLLDSGISPDEGKLSSILERHGLASRWAQLLTERGRG